MRNLINKLAIVLACLLLSSPCFASNKLHLGFGTSEMKSWSLSSFQLGVLPKYNVTSYAEWENAKEMLGISSPYASTIVVTDRLYWEKLFIHQMVDGKPGWKALSGLWETEDKTADDTNKMITVPYTVSYTFLEPEAERGRVLSIELIFSIVTNKLLAMETRLTESCVKGKPNALTTELSSLGKHIGKAILNTEIKRRSNDEYVYPEYHLYLYEGEYGMHLGEYACTPQGMPSVKVIDMESMYEHGMVVKASLADHKF